MIYPEKSPSSPDDTTGSAKESPSGWPKQVRCNITQADEIATMVPKAVEGLGRTDILLSNGGVG